jgi:hypothetical protein
MEVVLTASPVLLYDFSSLKTSYSIVKSYTVHIHAILGGGGPKWQPLNVMLLRYSCETPVRGGSVVQQWQWRQTMATGGGGMSDAAFVQCWIFNYVIFIIVFRLFSCNLASYIWPYFFVTYSCNNLCVIQAAFFYFWPFSIFSNVVCCFFLCAAIVFT